MKVFLGVHRSGEVKHPNDRSSISTTQPNHHSKPPLYLDRPIHTHILSSSNFNSLEPIYFWIHYILQLKIQQIKHKIMNALKLYKLGNQHALLSWSYSAAPRLPRAYTVVAPPLKRPRNNLRVKASSAGAGAGGEGQNSSRRTFLTLEEAGLVEISGLDAHERFLCRLTVRIRLRHIFLPLLLLLYNCNWKFITPFNLVVRVNYIWDFSFKIYSMSNGYIDLMRFVLFRICLDCS